MAEELIALDPLGHVMIRPSLVAALSYRESHGQTALVAVLTDGRTIEAGVFTDHSDTVRLREEVLEALRQANGRDSRDRQQTLAYELKCLWSDFADALHAYIARGRNPDPADERSGWSVRMLGLADRIAFLTAIAGPTPRAEVPYSIPDHWWDAVHVRMDRVVAEEHDARVELGYI